MIFIAVDGSSRHRQANARSLCCYGNAHLLTNFVQLVQVARPNISRNHQEDNYPEIASRSIYPDASAACDILHWNVADGDASEYVRRVPKEISSDLPAKLSLLASSSNHQLPAGAATLASGLHGLRLFPLGQHSLLRKKTKADAREKQLKRS